MSSFVSLEDVKKIYQMGEVQIMISRLRGENLRLW